MLSQLKSKIEKKVDVVIKLLVKLKISPDFLTWTGLIFSLIAAIFIARNEFLYALIVGFIGGIFDFVDGAVARYGKRVTKHGSFLDSTLDRISDGAIFGAVLFTHKVDQFTALVMLVSALLVSYIRAKGESLGIKKMNIGLMERSERLLFLALLGILDLLIPSFDKPFFTFNFFIGSWFSILYALMTFLTVITVIQRIVYVLKIVD